MEKNKDYCDGVKLLLNGSRKKNFNIKEYPWVIDLSLILSKYNVCYKFWNYTLAQDRLSRIKYCSTIKDIMYGMNRSLFSWAQTFEGHTYWENLLDEAIFKGIGAIELKDLKWKVTKIINKELDY